MMLYRVLFLYEIYCAIINCFYLLILLTYFFGRDIMASSIFLEVEKMKKFVFFTLIAALSCMFVLTAAAEGTYDLEWTKGQWDKIKHVSNDELRTADDKEDIVCASKNENICWPTLPSGRTGVIFWGWATAVESDITGFSYSINGGEKVTDPKFKPETEEAVINAGKTGWKGEFTSRLKVLVPLTEGTQLVRIFADFADGSSEIAWISEITVGEKTEYTDKYDTTDPDPDATKKPDTTAKPDATKKPDNTNPPKTGDADLIFAVAACGIVMTAFLKKKVQA